MAVSVSLTTLIQRVRQRANLETGPAVTNIQFVPDQEVQDCINQAIYPWWDMVRLTTFMGQYARTTFPFVTAANQSLYPLPQDLASIISVDANINNANYAINAMPYQEEQRNMFKLYPFVGWAFGGFQNVWYQIQGQYINFLPTPESGYNIAVNYVPNPSQLQNPEDTILTFSGWEEWIVLEAAIKLLVKDAATTMIPILQGMQAEWTARIQHAAAMADMNVSEGVHEGQEPSNNGYGFGGWGWM